MIGPPVILTAFTVLLCFAVAATGCRGGDEASDRAHDEAIAREAALTLADLPSRWRVDDDEEADDRADCDAIKLSRSESTARATSPRFAEGETRIVENTTYVFADDETSARAFEALSSKETRTCVGDALVERTQAGLEDAAVGDAVTSRLDVDPVGTDSSASRVSMPLTVQGTDVDVVADFTFIRVGRAVTILTVGDVGAPFDDDLRSEFAGTVARRLDTALVR